MTLFSFLRPAALLRPLLAPDPAGPSRPAPHPKTRSRAAAARRGRVAVVGAVLFFALIQMAFFPLSDPWPQVQDAEYGHKLRNLRRQLRAKPPGQPAVVMFGSSLTGWALNPGAMGELKPGSPGGPVVFNMGIDSSGAVARLMVLKRVLADGIRPDLVLVETHPWFLFDKSRNFIADKDHFFPAQRLRPGDLFLLIRYDPEPGELLRAWTDDHWVPWYAHRHNLQNYLVPRWVRKSERTGIWDYTDRHGWEGGLNAVSQPLSPRESESSARYHTEAMTPAPLYLESARAYREIVGTCQKAQIPLILIRMPEMRVMRETSPQAFQDKVNGFYTQLRNETGVAIVDARGWVEDAHFRDGFHAYPAGSVAFSQRLEREVLLPMAKTFTPAGNASRR